MIISFIKKNLLTLLIGAIIGFAIAGSSIYSTMSIAHNRSKKKATIAHEKQIAEIIASHERILIEKNILISECIQIDKRSYTNNNEFNPEIAKNKKGNIIIDLTPDIDQKLTNEKLVQDLIQNPQIEAEKSDTIKEKRKRKKFLGLF